MIAACKDRQLKSVRQKLEYWQGFDAYWVGYHENGRKSGVAFLVGVVAGFVTGWGAAIIVICVFS